MVRSLSQEDYAYWYFSTYQLLDYLDLTFEEISNGVFTSGCLHGGYPQWL
jgi:hypothetical protein